jgi:hypothetical protein
MEATLNDMVAAGALSQVLVAFSREKGVPKTYVQVGGTRIVEAFEWGFLRQQAPSAKCWWPSAGKRV